MTKAKDREVDPPLMPWTGTVFDPACEVEVDEDGKVVVADPKESKP